MIYTDTGRSDEDAIAGVLCVDCGAFGVRRCTCHDRLDQRAVRMAQLLAEARQARADLAEFWRDSAARRGERLRTWKR